MWFCDCVRLLYEAYISLIHSFSQVLSSDDFLRIISLLLFFSYFLFASICRCLLSGTFVFNFASKSHVVFWVVPLVRSVDKNVNGSCSYWTSVSVLLLDIGMHLRCFNLHWLLEQGGEIFPGDVHFLVKTEIQHESIFCILLYIDQSFCLFFWYVKKRTKSTLHKQDFLSKEVVYVGKL